MDDRIDQELRALGRAARGEVETGLDLEADLAAVHAGGPASLADPILPGRSSRGVVWLGAAAAAVATLIGGMWLLRSDDTVQTADPATTVPAITAAATSVPDVTATTMVAPTSSSVPPSTVVPTEPIVRPGSIELGPDDLIARSVDGDVWWYPGALVGSPEERILLIDREDPRPVPDEGEGRNFIDQVAGTFNGSLVYGDCCEPVSGNLFAISEPGAEADLWTSPTGLSDRAQLWGLGYGPRFEPGGTRVVSANWDIVQVVDLATGTISSIMTDEAGAFGALDAAWAGGSVAVLAFSDEDGWFLSVRDPDRLATESERVVIDPPSEVFRTVEIVGVSDAELTISIRDEGQPLRFVTVETGTWTVVESEPVFDVPPVASYVRLADGGDLMAWVVDDVGTVQRLGGEPFTLDTGLAAIWFPEIRGEPAATPTGTTVPGDTSPDTAVPETTIPDTTVPSAAPVDWRDLPWGDSGIPNSCVRASLICTRVIHDPDGAAISYDPVSRVLTRHTTPAVSTTLPDSYGDVWLSHAGPDDVVYLQVAPAVPAELAADLVALTLSEGDAGREIGRWGDVVDMVGDSELVATSAGLVDVDCCGPDTTRPDPDAVVLVPWIDRTGSQVVSPAPSIRVVLGTSEMTVQRTGGVPDGTWEWSFEPAGSPFLRGMPDVLPTFDGGFVAALYGEETTIVRGRPNGDLDQVVVGDLLFVALDRSGRFLVPDEGRFVRVEPFADRTLRPGDGTDVDVDAGTLTLPDLGDVSADWLDDPVAFADAVRGPLAVNEWRTITAQRRSQSEWVVTVTTSNFFDDSVFADRWELTLDHDGDGWFSFVAGTWSNACQPGRGHQGFSNERCV